MIMNMIAQIYFLNKGASKMTDKRTYRSLKISIAIIAAMVAFLVLFSASVSDAATSLEAKGQINSFNGAFMRKKATKSSKIVAGLHNNTQVVILKEVFTTRTKTKASKKWYYIYADGKKGYVRSDLVDNIQYPTGTAQTKAKIYYRKGAGTSMKRKGKLKKKATFTVVLEAKAYGSGKKWYKIQKGNDYYYVASTSVKLLNVAPLPAAQPAVQVASTAPAADSAPAATVTPPEQVLGYQSAASVNICKGAAAWARAIANDNSFHYGNGTHCHHNGCYYCGTQPTSKKNYVVQWEKTYCCNPFVTAAFAHGGNEPFMLNSVCKKGKSYMAPEFTKSALFANMGHPAQSELKVGDVLCTTVHVAIYLGDGTIAEACTEDNGVPGSSSWNNSIRISNLTASRYAGFKAGVFRYIGSN